MTDVRLDRQTGQQTDDFVGDTTYAGFQQKAGILNGQDSFLFRARFDTMQAVNTFGSNGGNFGLGLDLNGDGALDLIVMFSETSNRTRSIRFGSPGTGANMSPSTTTWSFPTQTAISVTPGQNYALTATDDGYNFNNTQDAWLTFGFSFASLENAIRLYAKVPTGQLANYWQNFTVDYNTMISFVAFTSTQDNKLNQDLFGTSVQVSNNNSSITTTFAELGALTPPISPFGAVPEPATYAQLAALLIAGGVVAYRRRRTVAPAAGPAAADTPVSPRG